jgi:hypothetical protein
MRPAAADDGARPIVAQLQRRRRRRRRADASVHDDRGGACRARRPDAHRQVRAPRPRSEGRRRAAPLPRARHWERDRPASGRVPRAVPTASRLPRAAARRAWLTPPPGASRAPSTGASRRRSACACAPTSAARWTSHSQSRPTSSTARPPQQSASARGRLLLGGSRLIQHGLRRASRRLCATPPPPRACPGPASPALAAPATCPAQCCAALLSRHHPRLPTPKPPAGCLQSSGKRTASSGGRPRPSSGATSASRTTSRHAPLSCLGVGREPRARGPAAAASRRSPRGP